MEYIARRWLRLSSWCVTFLIVIGLASPAAASTLFIDNSHFDLEFETASFMAQSSPAASPVGEPWALQKLGVPHAWNLNSGSDVIVAVLDSGLSASHPALSEQVLPGWNFVHGTDDTRDDAGHGTFNAGIIAARRSPDHRMAGVAPGAKILPVKILDSQGAGSTANFVAGIVYAVDHGAKVINISASGVSNSQSLADAVQYAEDHGAVVVASAGNQANGDMNYPAAYTSVLAVTATGPDDTVAAFSSFGPYVDLAAPGVNIPSTWWESTKGDTYRTASGTSAAAAYVSGVAALIMSARPDISPSQVRQLLTETAADIGPPGIDASSGFGRLDAYLSTRLATPVHPSRPATASVVSEPGGRHVKIQSEGFEPEEPLALWVTGADGRHWVYRGITVGSAGA
ncbi:MAG TPA: S8 family serine peptidase, partial [Nitrolancea sp.]|nr:S8 family serine peptidase [Nitrolancea sp.]